MCVLRMGMRTSWRAGGRRSATRVRVSVEPPWRKLSSQQCARAHLHSLWVRICVRRLSYVLHVCVCALVHRRQSPPCHLRTGVAVVQNVPQLLRRGAVVGAYGQGEIRSAERSTRVTIYGGAASTVMRKFRGQGVSTTLTQRSDTKFGTPRDPKKSVGLHSWSLRSLPVSEGFISSFADAWGRGWGAKARVPHAAYPPYCDSNGTRPVT